MRINVFYGALKCKERQNKCTNKLALIMIFHLELDFSAVSIIQIEKTMTLIVATRKPHSFRFEHEYDFKESKIVARTG